MDGLTTSTAGYAAIISGIFWLLYLLLVMVELSGKVPYTATYKAIGLSTGVLQALPIILPAMVLYDLFGGGTLALNVTGLIAGIASVLLITLSILKMIPKGTKFEEVSDLMQSGFGLLAIWILAVSLLSIDMSLLSPFTNILGIVVGIGLGIGAVVVLIFGPISPGISNDNVPRAAVWLSYVLGGIGFIGYPVWAILLGVALIRI
jgi:hypothetical protein